MNLALMESSNRVNTQLSVNIMREHVLSRLQLNYYLLLCRNELFQYGVEVSQLEASFAVISRYRTISIEASPELQYQVLLFHVLGLQKSLVIKFE